MAKTRSKAVRRKTKSKARKASVKKSTTRKKVTKMGKQTRAAIARHARKKPQAQAVENSNNSSDSDEEMEIPAALQGVSSEQLISACTTVFSKLMPGVVAQVRKDFAEIHAANAKTNSSTLAPPAGGPQEPMENRATEADRVEDRQVALFERLFSAKDDPEAQLERKTERTKKRLREHKFVPLDHTLLVALKDFSEHLFGDDGKRATANPKTSTFFHLILIILTEGVHRIDELKKSSPERALECAEDLLRYLLKHHEWHTRHELISRIKFHNTNHQDACKTGRLIGAYKNADGDLTDILERKAKMCVPVAKPPARSVTSNKSKRTPQGKIDRPCFDFILGNCTRGASCRYRHDNVLTKPVVAQRIPPARGVTKPAPGNGKPSYQY